MTQVTFTMRLHTDFDGFLAPANAGSLNSFERCNIFDRLEEDSVNQQRVDAPPDSRLLYYPKQI